MTAMTLIESKTLASAAASIEFTSIPSTFTDLVAVLSIRTNRSPQKDDLIAIRINGVTTNQSERELFGNGSTTGSSTGLATIYSYANSAGATSDTFGNSSVYIPNYTAATAKSFSVDSVNENNATGAYQSILAGLWNSTAAITSLEFYPLYGTTLNAGSIISLYGVLKGSSGGVIIV
jgi:hypothetical protein